MYRVVSEIIFTPSPSKATALRESRFFETPCGLALTTLPNIFNTAISSRKTRTTQPTVCELLSYKTIMQGKIIDS